MDTKSSSIKDFLDSITDKNLIYVSIDKFKNEFKGSKIIDLVFRSSKENISSRLNTNLKDASKEDLYKISKEIEKEMHVAADLLEFEVAARLRDELKEIKKEIMELPN